MNRTQSTNCSSSGNPTAERIGKIIAYCLLSVVSLVGNCLIGVTVYKTKPMRKTINFLIVNMAISDLFYPTFVFPFVLQNLSVDSQLVGGPLGNVFCKVVSLLQYISTSVSIQSLVLIGIDRLVAVVFPLRSPLISSKLCPFVILTTWILAILIYSPAVLYAKLVCGLVWHQYFEDTFFRNYILITLSVVLFYIPFTLIIVLYSIIAVTINLKKIAGETSMNAEEQHSRRQRNVLNMAIAIVLGFALCWLPFNIIVALSFFGVRSHCTFMQYWFVIQLLTHSNCAVNPCICLSSLFRARYPTDRHFQVCLPLIIPHDFPFCLGNSSAHLNQS